MHRTLLLVLIVGILAAKSGAGADQTGHRDNASHIRREQIRLRSHFDSVLVELRARDVSRLTPSQRAARSELTTWLAEYRDAGTFPLNDRYADRSTPIFRDANGATCAMAYLIERSGRGDIVDRVGRERNLAYIVELAADPELVAWLDSAGLSVEEASRVQPTYAPRPDEIVDKSYARWSVLGNGASIATATWNLARPGDPVGLLGVFVGALTVLQSVGSDQLGNAPRRDKGIDTFSRVTGGSAIIAGLWAINQKPRSTEASARISRVEMTPILGVPIGSRQFTVGLTAKF